MIRLIVLLLVLGSAASAVGQDLLVIEHTQRLKRFRFERGSTFEVMWQGEPRFRRVTLVGFRPDTLLLVGRDDFEIVLPLAWVEGFRLSSRDQSSRFTYLIGTAAVAGGAALLLVRSVNGLSDNLSPVVPEQTWLLSGSLIVGGFALTRLGRPRTIELGKRWQARILDLGLLQRPKKQ